MGGRSGHLAFGVGEGTYETTSLYVGIQLMTFSSGSCLTHIFYVTICLQVLDVLGVLLGKLVCLSLIFSSAGT